MKYPYSIATDLSSAYNLPTDEARYDFAQFRTRVSSMTTRKVYQIFNANKKAVTDYTANPALQYYCVTAAARRDFAASILNTRGLSYNASSDDFNRY